MSYYNIGLDRGLNPPEPNCRGDCDCCGNRHEYSDMHEVYDDTWLCDECYEERARELMGEEENE